MTAAGRPLDALLKLPRERAAATTWSPPTARHISAQPGRLPAATEELDALAAVARSLQSLRNDACNTPYLRGDARAISLLRALPQKRTADRGACATAADSRALTTRLGARHRGTGHIQRTTRTGRRVTR